MNVSIPIPSLEFIPPFKEFTDLMQRGLKAAFYHEPKLMSLIQLETEPE